MNVKQHLAFHFFERLLHMLGGENTKWTMSLENEIKKLYVEILESGDKVFALNPANFQEALDWWCDKRRIKKAILERICYDLVLSFVDIPTNHEFQILRDDWFEFAKIEKDSIVVGYAIQSNDETKPHSITIVTSGKSESNLFTELMHMQQGEYNGRRVVIVSPNQIPKR